MGPVFLSTRIALDSFLHGKNVPWVRLKSIALLSSTHSASDGEYHEMLVNPPMQSPSFILNNDIVGPLLLQYMWKT